MYTAAFLVSARKWTNLKQKDITMLTDLQRQAVVQRILNLAAIAENLNDAANSITKEIDDLAEALEVGSEDMPLDEDFL